MTARYSDFDGDLRAEIPVSSPSGLGLLELDGGVMTSAVMAPNGTRFGGWLLNSRDNRFDLLGDFDGDGRTEMFVSSPWGIGILRQTDGSFTPLLMAPNGTRFGGWLLNTTDNRFGPVGDFDGDGRDEIMFTSPWGVGIMKWNGAAFTSVVMAPNGTRAGIWSLDTATDRFSLVGDMNADGRAEIVVSSPTGIAVLQLAGASLNALVVVSNGLRIGGWLLNTADNHLVALADLDGDRRADLVISSPWGIGVLRLDGAGLTARMLAPNGTRFGGWLLNTLDDRIGPVADYDGDGRAELFMSSPWGIGILKMTGTTFASPMMAPNGTRFGGWLLNTADNRFDHVGDFDGDGRAELLVTSPWGLGVLELSGATLAVQAMAPNGTRFGGWLLNTANDKFEIGEQSVRLHVKVLTTPTIAIERMVESMQRVYEGVGVRVHRVSTESLALPALNDIDVGGCSLGVVTAEQTQLFANRRNAWGQDIVVYFVRSTVPPYNGCAAHPAGRPGAVVAQGATTWTLGHEVGHVLGLLHVNDNNRLMTGNGTSNITNLPPDLVATEVIAMRASTLTRATL